MNIKFVYLFIYLGASFVLAVAVIPQILKIVLGKKIFDIPGGRKIHKQQTPSMGGIGVFFSFILMAMLVVHETEIFMAQYYYFSLILLFFTGLRDDLLPMKSSHKFLIQFIAASIIVGAVNVRLTSLYSLNFLSVELFPEWFSFFITVLVIVVLTNAFNLIDGIDGLAGSISLIVLSVLVFWFAINNYWEYAFLSVIMEGAIIGFLYYNWCPAKIFMGDTGSLIIGFFCTSMLIIFMNVNQSAQYKIDFSALFFLTLFIYPIFDTLRIVAVRLKKKKSPFSPDKLHIHSLLLRLGFNHNQITLIIILFSLSVLLLFFILSFLNINEIIAFVTVIIYCYFYSYLLGKRVKKFKKNKKLFDVEKSVRKQIASKS